MPYNFELNRVYSFDTNAPAILGARIENAKLTGILDFDSARRYDEVHLKYRNIYPLLPAGTPDQPEECIYYKFKAENGSVLVLADQWINESSIEMISSITAVITITDTSVQDANRIRDALHSLGYFNFSIKLNNNSNS